MTTENDSPRQPESRGNRLSAHRSLAFKFTAVFMSVSLTILLLAAIPQTRAILLHETRNIRRGAKVWYQDSIADLFSNGDLAAVHRQFLMGTWPPGSVTYCPASGYTIMPGFHGEMYCEVPRLARNYPLHFHSAGYRISEDADQQAFKRGGILSTGCSFTFGDEIAGSDTYSCTAAKELWGGNGPLAAYNYGVCQSGYPEMIHRLERLQESGILDALQPQCLVIGCISDLARRSFLTQFSATGLGAAGKSFVSKEAGDYEIFHFKKSLDPSQVFEFRNDFFGDSIVFPRSIDDRITMYPFAEREELIRTMSPIVTSTTESYWAQAEASDKKYYKSIGSQITGDVQQHPGLKFYEFIFGKFVEIADRNAIRRIVVMWLPSSGDDRHSQNTLARRAVANLFEDNVNITFVDGWDVIKNHPNWDGIQEPAMDRYGRGRTHPGTSGMGATVWNSKHPDEDSHRLYGQQLAAVLRRMNIAPLSDVTFSAPSVDTDDPLFLKNSFKSHVIDAQSD